MLVDSLLTVKSGVQRFAGTCWIEMSFSPLSMKALFLLLAYFLLLESCWAYHVKPDPNVNLVKKTHYFENVRAS